MNLTNILSKKQKQNLKKHYLKYKNSFEYLITPLSLHEWLSSYVFNGEIGCLIYMANHKVKK